MKHERYIINDEEIALLNQYDGIENQQNGPCRYDNFDKDSLAMFCRMKDRSNDLFIKRYQAAREVIDLIAKTVGINPADTSFWRYAPDIDGSSPIVGIIEEWVSRSGEKAQLKRKVKELEQENSVLRSLIQK